MTLPAATSPWTRWVGRHWLRAASTARRIVGSASRVRTPGVGSLDPARHRRRQAVEQRPGGRGRRQVRPGDGETVQPRQGPPEVGGDRTPDGVAPDPAELDTGQCGHPHRPRSPLQDRGRCESEGRDGPQDAGLDTDGVVTVERGPPSRTA